MSVGVIITTEQKNSLIDALQALKKRMPEGRAFIDTQIEMLERKVDTATPKKIVTTEAMKKVLQEIINERERQEIKWGEQNHHPCVWLPILGEEYGEVSKAICEAYFAGYRSTGDWSQYRVELIHNAAVAVAMAESYDRNGPPEKDGK